VRTRRELGRNTARLLERHPDLAATYLVPVSRASARLLRNVHPARPEAFERLAEALLSAGERLHPRAPGAGLRLMWLSSDALQAAGLLEADPTGGWLRRFTAARPAPASSPVLLPIPLVDG
jgi:hypothetical protein